MRLSGYLSVVDGKKLVFEFLDNYDEGVDESGRRATSRAQLEQRFAGSDHPPYDHRTFSVHCRDVTDDIRAMTGRQVAITVYTQRYSFMSRARYNRGERIQGEKLMLDTIDLVTRI